MADKNTLEQMLEHLVNDEQEKAEELFHEYVVARSREIYESLIEEEMKDEDDEEDEEDQVDEEFEDIAIEADDDEEDEGGPDMTGDLEAEIDMDSEEEKEPEEMFVDMKDMLDELEAEFAKLKGDESDIGDMDDEEMKDDMDLETVREYVEKVPAGHGAEKKGSAEQADNKKSIIDNMKNDMGGTTANIARGGEEKGGDHAGLSQIKAKEENAGNINVPGGKAGGAFSTKEPGHGAEKKGAAEQADNKQSLFRGRR